MSNISNAREFWDVESFDANSFREWADDEIREHGNISFDDWADEEYNEVIHNGANPLTFVEWVNQENREASHNSESFFSDESSEEMPTEEEIKWDRDMIKARRMHSKSKEGSSMRKLLRQYKQRKGAEVFEIHGDGWNKRTDPNNPNRFYYSKGNRADYTKECIKHGAYGIRLGNDGNYNEGLNFKGRGWNNIGHNTIELPKELWEDYIKNSEAPICKKNVLDSESFAAKSICVCSESCNCDCGCSEFGVCLCDSSCPCDCGCGISGEMPTEEEIKWEREMMKARRMHSKSKEGSSVRKLLRQYKQRKSAESEAKCGCGCLIGKCGCPEGCDCGCNHQKGGAKWAQAESFETDVDWEGKPYTGQINPDDPDLDPVKADRNKDGQLSSWERALGNQVARGIREGGYGAEDCYVCGAEGFEACEYHSEEFELHDWYDPESDYGEMITHPVIQEQREEYLEGLERQKELHEKEDIEHKIKRANIDRRIEIIESAVKNQGRQHLRPHKSQSKVSSVISVKNIGDWDYKLNLPKVAKWGLLGLATVSIGYMVASK